MAQMANVETVFVSKQVLATCTCCLPGDCGVCHNKLHSIQQSTPSISNPQQSSQPPTHVPSQPSHPPPAVSPQPSLSQSSLSSSAQPFVSHPSPPSTHPSLPDLDSIMSISLPTLKHVPKMVRDEWASLLGDLCYNVRHNSSDTDEWKKLFMLPRCILSSPPKAGRMLWYETVRMVKARIKKWRAGALSELWEEVQSNQKTFKKLMRSLSKRSRDGHSLRKQNVRRARTAVENGQFRKVIKALSSEGLAKVTQEVVETMLVSTLSQQLLQSHLTAPAKVPNKCVFKAIKSFPNGTAPGPSGLRASHAPQ